MARILLTTFLAPLVFGCGSDKPTSGPGLAPATKAIENFAIYYGWPSSLNSATLKWDNTNVANFLKQYSLVVFGAGLELSSHTDHPNMVSIAAAMKGQTEIFGYVNIGNTDSFSIATIQSRIDS